MSILIKGMEMPKSCSECDLRVLTVGFDIQCAISGETVDDYYFSRHPKCPIVEVPTPHGRLIDADNVSSDAMCSHCVEEYCRNNCECFIENVQTILSNELITPTIIEAEVSE